jgi:DnaJ-class molecular chaperone
MTALDMVVIAAGLLFGYRLVSNYLSPHVSEEPQAPKPLTLSAPAWFEVLDVAENADLADIERAYRTKISQYHPDKVAQMGKEIRQLAETRCKEINAAYETALRLRKR